MATEPDANDDPTSRTYLPRAARAVPRSEVVHTIQFRRISYPLTERSPELWIVETNHDGHVRWRNLESYLDTFLTTSIGDSSTVALAHLESLAHQWRQYYDVPRPYPLGGPPHRHHLLPQPHHSNTHFEPVSVVQITDLCYRPVGDDPLFDSHREILLPVWE